VKKSVTNKRDFARRYALGEFGNAAPTWPTIKEFFAAHKDIENNPHLYSLRNRVANSQCMYNLTIREINEYTQNRKNQDLSEFYVSEMAPHNIGIINGEICRTYRGLTLFYARGDRPMRLALKKGVQVEGLQADLILRSKTDPSGYNWIKELLEEYPNHTVEFTSFSHPWGTLASVGHCTVIWEVRLY